MIENISLSVLVAFAASLVFLRILDPVAHNIGLIDHPGGRKIHDRPTPLVGGIAMFTAFAFAILVSDAAKPSCLILFAGAFLLVVFGVLDDFRGRSPRQRFGVQIAASLLMALGAEVKLDDFGFLVSPHWELTLGNLAVPVTLFSTVGVINALNMVDGLDGLAASLVLVTTAALGIAAWSVGNTEAIAVLLVLVAVVLAFLLLNLRLNGRALVFMGDAGSMFLGFVIAWFLIHFSQGEDGFLEPVTALWIFALPLFDAVAITVRRMLGGRSPFACDREHFHHLLLAAGLSPKQTLALMLLLALIAAAIGLTGQFLDVAEHWMFLAYLGSFAGYFWMISSSWRRKRLLNRRLAPCSEPGS